MGQIQQAISGAASAAVGASVAKELKEAKEKDLYSQALKDLPEATKAVDEALKNVLHEEINTFAKQQKKAEDYSTYRKTASTFGEEAPETAKARKESAKSRYNLKMARKALQIAGEELTAARFIKQTNEDTIAKYSKKFGDTK